MYNGSSLYYILHLFFKKTKKTLFAFFDILNTFSIDYIAFKSEPYK